MIDRNSICCSECEAEFKIEHDEVNDPKFCPFCSTQLDIQDYNTENDELDEE